MSPLILNAFDLIILSEGLNLASLFDRDQVNHCLRVEGSGIAMFNCEIKLNICFDHCNSVF